MCVSFIIIITIKCIIIVSRRDFKDMKQIAIYIRQAKKWRLSDYGNKTQQSPNVGQRTSELDSSEFVSFLLMNGKQGRRDREIHVPRNFLPTEFDDHWHTNISRRRTFFARSITLPSPANRRRLPYSMSASNGRGHWRVAMLMNLGSMLPKSIWYII